MRMFDRTYSFHGNARWDLGLGNPNLAGCLLVAILVLAWVAYDRCSGRGLIYRIIVISLLECFGLFLILKTYSRGAVVSLIVCSFVLTIVKWKNQSGWPKWWLGRFFAGMLIAYSVGFFERMSPEYILNDPSSTNRLDYWYSFCGMIRHFPMGLNSTVEGGVGWLGASGFEYVNYFQPLGQTFVLNGPVNSFIFISLEYGLFWLVLCLVPLIVCILCIWRARVECVNCYIALSVFSIYVSGIFSTLLFRWPVFVILCSLLIWLLYNKIFLQKCSVGLFRSTLISIGLVVVVYFSSWMIEEDQVNVAYKGESVFLSTIGESVDTEMVIILDPTVTGIYPGRELRYMCQQNRGLGITIVRAPPLRVASSVDYVVLVGSAIREYDAAISDVVNYVFFEPNINFVPKGGVCGMVVLPIFDRDGTNEFFRRLSTVCDLKFWENSLSTVRPEVRLRVVLSELINEN